MHIRWQFYSAGNGRRQLLVALQLCLSILLGEHFGARHTADARSGKFEFSSYISKYVSDSETTVQVITKQDAYCELHREVAYAIDVLLATLDSVKLQRKFADYQLPDWLNRRTIQN